jgi:C4-dicarboxylate transporter
MRVGLPRVRVRVRGLMLAVAVAAVAIGACQMWSRRSAYLALAAEHAGLELGSQETGQVCRENVVGLACRGSAP